MVLLQPKAGLVIWYDYLWLQELKEGFDRPAKARPALIARVGRTSAGRTRVVILPITRTPQHRGARFVPIPMADVFSLKLDQSRQSVVVTDNVNIADWPLRDLRERGKASPRTAVLGVMSFGVTQRVGGELAAIHKQRQLKIVDREALRLQLERESRKWREQARTQTDDDNDEPEAAP